MLQFNDSESKADILCVASNKCTKVWILYSGCSYHMRTHQEGFTTFNLDNLGFIYLCNDKAYTITEMTQIIISIDDG